MNFKTSQLFTDFPFIWLDSLKFVERGLFFYFIISRVHFAASWATPVGAAAPLPAAQPHPSAVERTASSEFRVQLDIA
jgi:hypothetical protein